MKSNMISISPKVLMVLLLLLAILVTHTSYASDLNNQLINAAYKGDTAAVEALLAKGADVSAKTLLGDTALICAINLRHADTVRVLIEKGADVNVKDHRGVPALTVATRQATLHRTSGDIVRVLLAKGADANATDKSGNNALYWAKFGHHAEIIQLLKEAGAEEKPARLIAKVKNMSGKEYTFVENSLYIQECHPGMVKVIKGIYYYYEPQDVKTHMFNIHVDMGDFKRIIGPNDVKVIVFEKVKDGSFDISLELRDNLRLHIQLLGEWPNVDEKDCLRGKEKQYGDISIPFTKIQEIQILDGSRIYRGSPTPAKLIKP